MKFLVLTLVFVTIPRLFALEWKPVPPEQLSLKTPKIDPNADAETVFWEAFVRDDPTSNGYVNHIVDNYIRIKLYNDRAVEKYGNVEIPYYSEKKMSLSQIRARTILPNGKILDVPGSAITESVVAKLGKTRNKVKAFALPGLEPGAIIEYQWTEVYSEYLPRYVSLVMQREIPAWEISYKVRPVREFGFSEQMKAYPFNCNPSPWEPVQKDMAHPGFVETHVNNVRALQTEPRMPAEDDVRAWMLLYYSPSTKDKPASYWPSVGKQLNSDFRKTLKLNNEIKQLAQQITAKGEDTFQKADLLHIYCVKEIKNVAYNAEGVTNEERTEFFKNLKELHTTADTLRLKKGLPDHIIALFYALAEAAGLNPSYVRAGSANGAVFRADFLDPYLLRNRMVAVGTGTNLRFYNPGIPYLPPGMLDWDEKGQPALVMEEKAPRLVVLPTTPAEASSIKRVAKLKLSEDGTVSGSVSQTYLGHFAVDEKLSFGEMSDGSREEDYKKRLEARFPGATIQKLKIENANSSLGILKVTYDIEMPNYAQRTGKRIFVPVGFFQYGEKPLFSAAKRQHPIVFRHAFKEEDAIELSYPAGFTLDNADMPGQTKISTVGDYTFNAMHAERERSISLKRSFVWGADGNIYFQQKAYEPLKVAWDQIHSFNMHTLTLKVQ